MNQAKTATLLTALDSDVEHHYRLFLRIAEVCIFGTVCRSLHERVQTSFRSRPCDAVHHNGIDPDPSTWLTGIAKLGLNLRSLRLVCSFSYAVVFLHTKPPWVGMVPYILTRHCVKWSGTIASYWLEHSFSHSWLLNTEGGTYGPPR